MNTGLHAELAICKQYPLLHTPNKRISRTQTTQVSTRTLAGQFLWAFHSRRKRELPTQQHAPSIISNVNTSEALNSQTADARKIQLEKHTFSININSHNCALTEATKDRPSGEHQHIPTTKVENVISGNLALQWLQSIHNEISSHICSSSFATLVTQAKHLQHGYYAEQMASQYYSPPL